MKILKIRDVKTPTRGTQGSAGLDFYIPNDAYGYNFSCIPPGESVNIPSGIKAEIPKGYALIAMNKSGAARRKGLQVSACDIGEGCRAEIHLLVSNISNEVVNLSTGEKLVQMLLIPVRYEDIEVVETESELFSSTSDSSCINNQPDI